MQQETSGSSKSSTKLTVPEVTTVNPSDLELELVIEESPDEYREFDLPETQNYLGDAELSDEE